LRCATLEDSAAASDGQQPGASAASSLPTSLIGIRGLPAKTSAFKRVTICFFHASDGVRFGVTGDAMAIKNPRQPILSQHGKTNPSPIFCGWYPRSGWTQGGFPTTRADFDASDRIICGPFLFPRVMQQRNRERVERSAAEKKASLDAKIPTLNNRIEPLVDMACDAVRESRRAEHTKSIDAKIEEFKTRQARSVAPLHVTSEHDISDRGGIEILV
jgi:hypothetical protein